MAARDPPGHQPPPVQRCAIAENFEMDLGELLSQRGNGRQRENESPIAPPESRDFATRGTHIARKAVNQVSHQQRERQPNAAADLDTLLTGRAIQQFT